MKLISMTKFVLEQKQSNSFKEKEFINAELFTLEIIRNYASFLKQPLTLGMFVPCGEDGNVLDLPEFYKHNLSSKEYIKKEQYREAKDRVLFEFEENHIDVFKYHISRNRTVEYLANFNQLELTPTAIKQLGL